VLYLKTLGHLSLHLRGPHGPTLMSNSHALAVCAVLATRPDHTASRDYLAELLWPNIEHSKARRALRQALHYMVVRTGEHVVQGDDSELTLDTKKLKVDLHEFERALQAGDDERVVELYGGHFLPGLLGTSSHELEEGIESQDEYVRAGVEVAYSRLVSGHLEAGEAGIAVRYARKYVELNPLNEAAQIALVRSLRAAGELVGALQAYRSYRALLKAALDGRPSEDLERLAAGVREQIVGDGPGAAGGPPLATGRGSRPWRLSLAGGAVGALLSIGLISVALSAGWLSTGEPEVLDGSTRPFFVEDWTEGLRADRWIPFGEPKPYVRATGGPEGSGYFVSNGDGSFASGVGSRLAFSPARGLSVDFWARMPFSGKPHQRMGVGLSLDEPPSDSREWSCEDAIVNLVIAGPSEEVGAWARVTVAGHWNDLEIPDESGAWHRYVLQLDADGTVSLHVDGALHWRSKDKLPVKAMEPVHVVLGYHSDETEIAHGPLRVYQGSRYVLP
jgi:DNA-binding SARP family transcriptional activator